MKTPDFFARTVRVAILVSTGRIRLRSAWFALRHPQVTAVPVKHGRGMVFVCRDAEAMYFSSTDSGDL
jgi:hypothetical protein